MKGLVWAALLTLTGFCVGSFVGLVADRWPRGEPALWGRSRCRSCNATIPPAALVPVLSYFALGGRCSRCNAAIPHDLWLIEAAAATIGLVGALVAPGPWALATAALGWTLLLAAILDARHFWLPIAFTLGLAAAGLALAAISGRAAESLSGAVLGFFSLEAVRLLYRAVRKRDGLGGGDPLLFGALGAWLGPAALPFVLLLAALGGLASAVIIATIRRAPLSSQTRVPLGAWLAAAGFVAWCVGVPA